MNGFLWRVHICVQKVCILLKYSYLFILNKGAKSGGEITHAVLNGSIVSKPAGWDAFHGLALAREKLSSEEIQQQMKELGVEMEIVPLI